MSSDFEKELIKKTKEEELNRVKIIKVLKEQQKEIINNYKDKSLTNFFFNIDKMSNEYTFQYIIIIILSIWISKYFNLSLNIIISIGVALIIIYYLYTKRDLYDLTHNEDLRLKLRTIIPKPKYFYTHPELINYFFYIREFKLYNDKAYTDSMNSVDILINLENQINNNVKDCHYLIDIAKQHMYDAINNIHSIIYTLPQSDVTINKYNKAIDELKILLLKIINEMINKCNHNLKEKGLGVFSVPHSKIKTKEFIKENNFNFY